jgi:hypothetical protein
VIITEPGVYDAIPNAEYHAHPDSLSVSGAKKLLPPYCPAIFQHERTNPVYKAVFDFGSAAHKYVLGDLDAKVKVCEYDSWRTKAAQTEQAEARAAGYTPILAADYQQVQEMVAAILAHPIASRLFSPDSGKPEQSLFWQDNPTGIWRRARLDWLPNPRDGRLIVADYKTCRSADPETFAKSAAEYGYHQQAQWYIDGIRACGLDNDPAFIFVAQEKTAPYLVSVIELDDTALAIGRNLNRGAINIYAECMKTGIWPGYTSGVELVSLPAWYARRFDEDAA